MTEDPYKTLGVAKTATQDEIKKAYRKLAKSLHPDLHPDDSSKEAEFQAISAAYDLLGDPEKRKRFDAGKIDVHGQERPERQYYHQYAGQDAGRRYDPGRGAGHFDDVSDLFADLFGHGQRGEGEEFRQSFQTRGPDLRYHLDIDFMDAVKGTKHSVTMPDGNTIELSIPAGIKDGQTLRLRGKGGPGYGGGPPGDGLVTVAVRAHPTFSRNGNDIEVELPITFDEAVLGAKVEVPTIAGPVSMTIPKGVSSGRQLRLRGRGVRGSSGKAGDQLVRLRIVLPAQIGAEMQALAEKWRDQTDFNPREGLEKAS